MIWLVPPNLQIWPKKDRFSWDQANRMLPDSSDTAFGEDVDIIQPAPSFGPVDKPFWIWTYTSLSRTSKTLLVSLDWTWSTPRPAVNKEKGRFP